MELSVLSIRELPRPLYRAIRYVPETPGYWEALNAALPELRFPHHSGAFPAGYLLIDPIKNVVVGWCSSLDNFEVV